MTHKLPPLPYAKDAIEPYISRETLEYHHGKHHRAYVTKLNALMLITFPLRLSKGLLACCELGFSGAELVRLKIGAQPRSRR